MVIESGCAGVLSSYEQALKELVDGPGKSGPVEFAWFSDTFLLYAQDDSSSSFRQIESRARLFMNALTMRRIPFTGALSCGDFLAQKEDSIFVGRALVESYRLCETQDWIGYVLSPTAVNRMRELGLPLEERLNYRFWSIPQKTRDSAGQELPALLLGGPAYNLGQNDCYAALQEMRNHAHNDRVRAKYDRTLHFLEQRGLIVIVPRIDEDLI